MKAGARSSVLIANPGFDRYGSDLQMLESVAALRATGWDVVVASPQPGSLAERLEATGATTRLVSYPVVQRADTTVVGALRLAAAASAAMPRLCGLIRTVRPDVVYVNTVTLPWWLLAARLMRVPAVCHVHEAEPDIPIVVRRVMASQLRLATIAITNSKITRDSLTDVSPRIKSRVRLIYNGVTEPENPVAPPRQHLGSVRAVVIGRLSQRKAPHVALETISLLRAEGIDATLEVCGSAVPGHNTYEDQLRMRAAEPDLVGAVSFSGYTFPVWSALARADIFLATSTAEPFGNAVVEAQMACRPVVATAVEGHLETVVQESTGLLVPVGDPVSMAHAVRRMIDEPGLAQRLAIAGQERAQRLFSLDEYRRQIVTLLECIGTRH